MAFTFTELLVEDGRAAAGAGDTPGSVQMRNAIRRFLVPGATPAQAALNPELRTEAGAGVPMPGVPGLVSIGYSIGRRIGPDSSGDVAYEAEAQYAPVGTPQFDFPSPDRQNINFISAGFSSFDKEVSFPIYVEKEIAAPNLVGPLSTTFDWEKVENLTVKVKCMAFQIEFNTTTLGAAQIAAIYTQTNKIHEFYGGKWLFRPQRADKIFRDGVWNVVYRWEFDPGTTTADLAEYDADPKICEIAPRPAHSDWHVVFDVIYSYTNSAPRLIAKGSHAVVPAGYQTLPGYAAEWGLT